MIQTLDPLHSKLKVFLSLNLELELLKGLELSLQNSKCVFDTNTYLKKFNSLKYKPQKKITLER